MNSKFFEKDESRGYNFPFILIYPEKPSNNIKIFVESYNSYDYEQSGKQDLEMQIKGAKKYAESLCVHQDGKRFTPAYLFQTINQPIIIPIIRRCDYEHPEEFYPQMLGKNVVFEKQGEFANISTQVVNMVKCIQERYGAKGYNVLEKSGLFGFSASGVFASRMQFAEPESFDLCLSICSNAVQPLPMDSLNGIPLPYPLGTHDYEDIFHKKFNLEEYKKSHQLFVVGEEESNDKYNIAYNDRLHDKQTQDIFTKVYGKVSLQERQKQMSKIFEELNFENINCMVGLKGHSLDGKGNNIISFLKSYLTNQPKMDDYDTLNF